MVAAAVSASIFGRLAGRRDPISLARSIPSRITRSSPASCAACRSWTFTVTSDSTSSNRSASSAIRSSSRQSDSAGAAPCLIRIASRCTPVDSIPRGSPLFSYSSCGLESRVSASAYLRVRNRNSPYSASSARLLRPARPDRHPVEVVRLVVRVHPAIMLDRPHRVPVRAPTLARQLQMHRDRPGARVAPPHERPRDRAVQHPPARTRQRPVRRLPDQVVGEPHILSVQIHEPHPHELLERGTQLRLAPPAHLAERRDGGVRTEHREHRETFLGGRRKLRAPAPDIVLHRPGQELPARRTPAPPRHEPVDIDR